MLGFHFHPPHFSEESSWLPAWLHPSSASNSPGPQGFEETGCLQKSISTRENESFSDDGRWKSFHLYLSGEDNSQMNFPSCSSNHEVQYHLHLSSNKESQSSLDPILSRSHSERSKVNPAHSVQQPEAKVILEKNTNELNDNVNESHMIPCEQKGNLGIPGYESLQSKEQKEVNIKVDSRSHKLDINDAVELAVAASEALTIHELIKDEIPVASAALEAAVRVKQARLEESNEIIGSFVQESNEIDFDLDFHSDVDEMTMADAYEDVGLLFPKHGDLSGYGSISHVKDSYASESYVSIPKQKCHESGGHEVDSGFIFPKEQHKQVNTANIIESSENQDLTSFQTARSSRKSGSSGYNEIEDKMTNLVPDRFQSRWFGGWTLKNEVSIPAVTDDKYKRNIPELFANETSNLSESAPDQNSCIQKQDDCNVISQISVAPEHAHDNKSSNNLNLVFDDVAASPIDPLCSVVPCSFTSNSESNVDNNLQRAPLESEVKSISKVNSESSPTILRKSASLKTYSRLNATCVEKEQTRGELLPFEHRVDQSNVDIDGHNQTAKGDKDLTNQTEKETRKVESSFKSYIVPRRKRVRFSEPQVLFPQKLKKTPQTRLKAKSRPQERVADHMMLFQDLKFLLTGFSVKKHKQIKNLIQNNGGLVFDDIPSSRKRCSKVVLILCPRKLLTTKFLYGCAVNACILKVKWLFDSLDEGLVLPPKKYMVLKGHERCMVIGKPLSRTSSIFDDIAIMLHGQPKFCCKMAKVIKHGGGLVFKTFHWLVKSLESKKVSLGIIVVEDENGISRQLKQCTLEQKIPMMPFKWIINSLNAGRLLLSPELKLPDHNTVYAELSEEI